jgi:hypothetical protein
VHTWTERPSAEVVAKQKDPGNEVQSASVWQPGTHCLPTAVVRMQAFGRPSALPPPAPNPSQSVDRVQALVHQSPLQERPGLQVLA